MTLYRKNPNFKTKDARESVIGGLFLAVVSFVFALFLILGYLLNGIKNRDYLSVLMSLFFVPVSILQGFMGIKMAIDGLIILNKRKRWIRNAIRIHTRVLEKKEESYEGSYDEGTICTYEMALDLRPFIMADNMDEQLVWVVVSYPIYRQHNAGDLLPVYYHPGAPLNFIIKGE
jgi:hypothetical protein